MMGIRRGVMGPKSENVKMSSAWIRPKWAYKQQAHIFPTYFACPKEAWHDKKANRRDKGTIGAKTGLQKRLYPTPVEVQKVIFLIKNALCLYSELCFLCGRGAHFQKKYEKIARNEKWSQKRLDGK